MNFKHLEQLSIILDNYWFHDQLQNISRSIELSGNFRQILHVLWIVAVQVIDHLYVINFRSSVRRQRSVSRVSSIISACLKRIVMWSLSIERNISAIYRIIIIQWSARIHDSLYTLFAPKSPLIPDCFVKAAIISLSPETEFVPEWIDDRKRKIKRYGYRASLSFFL